MVSHEVVGPCHDLCAHQALYVRGKLGFQSTVLTMDTRLAALFEGIANNGVLIAYARLRSFRTKTCDRIAARASQATPEPVVWLTWKSPKRKLRRRSGATFSSRPSARTSSPAPGGAIPFSDACTCPLTAPARKSSRSCVEVTRPKKFCLRSTAAKAWSTSSRCGKRLRADSGTTRAQWRLRYSRKSCGSLRLRGLSRRRSPRSRRHERTTDAFPVEHVEARMRGRLPRHGCYQTPSRRPSVLRQGSHHVE